MHHWKPGPVVLAVFIAGMLGVWGVVGLVVFYGILLEPVDVAVNMVVFMTLAGWWTEHMRKP